MKWLVFYVQVLAFYRFVILEDEVDFLEPHQVFCWNPKILPRSATVFFRLVVPDVLDVNDHSNRVSLAFYKQEYLSFICKAS